MAYLRINYPERVIESVEYHNAANIMLRSISFLLMLFSLSQIGLCIHKNRNLVICFGVSFIVFISSILLGKESARRKRWFYFTLYEAVVAGRLSPNHLVGLVNEKNPECDQTE